MNYRVAELAGVDAAQQVIQAYDVTSNQWNLPMEGNFWEAVRRAHVAGYRGRGRRVAILDSSCDFSIPRLKQQVKIKRNPLSGEPNQHGTAVALLVSEIVPEAQIDFYSVTRDGTPVFDDIQLAIQEATQTDANVITMSLGLQTQVSLIDEIEEALQQNRLEHAIAHSLEYSLGHNGLLAIRPETPPCGVCNAAIAAITSGKMVFAAVGNDLGCMFCPARATDVIAVGFQLDERSVELLTSGGYREISRALAPSYNQSIGVDVSLKQPLGVLGSSFACPLLAGAAALGFREQELGDFVTSVRLSANASEQHLIAKDKQTPKEEKKRAQECAEKFYRSALEKHPHEHEPNLKSDPCFECGVLSEPLFVNGGLFFAETKKPQEAERLLRIARWFAPWSADAAANLGRTLQILAEKEHASGRKDTARSLLTEALEHYEVALSVRKGFEVYRLQVDTIKSLFLAWFG